MAVPSGSSKNVVSSVAIGSGDGLSSAIAVSFLGLPELTKGFKFSVSITTFETTAGLSSVFLEITAPIFFSQFFLFVDGK